MSGNSLSWFKFAFPQLQIRLNAFSGDFSHLDIIINLILVPSPLPIFLVTVHLLSYWFLGHLYIMGFCRYLPLGSLPLYSLNNDFFLLRKILHFNTASLKCLFLCDYCFCLYYLSCVLLKIYPKVIDLFLIISFRNYYTFMFWYI
jgi:hypothetical protein